MEPIDIVILNGQRYEVDVCGQCGVSFVVPQIVRDYQRRKGGYAHCCNGHTWGWKTGTEEDDKIRRERDRAVQEQARLTGELIAAEKKNKKLLKRIGAGVCPCCKRSFGDLARHMSTKHPEIAPFKKKEA